MLVLGLWFKMIFVALSMVSLSRIFLKGLVTSHKIRSVSERFAFLIWETKEKVSNDNKSYH